MTTFQRPFEDHVPGLTSPAGDFYNVTPNDSTDLERATRGVIINSGGTFKYTNVYGRTDTVTLPSGGWPLRCLRIWSTGTTASGITALV